MFQSIHYILASIYFVFPLASIRYLQIFGNVYFVHLRKYWISLPFNVEEIKNKCDEQSGVCAYSDPDKKDPNLSMVLQICKLHLWSLYRYLCQRLKPGVYCMYVCVPQSVFRVDISNQVLDPCGFVKLYDEALKLSRARKDFCS